MQIDINLTSVLGYGFLALMSVITYLLKQAVDGIKKQIETLQETDKKLSDDIHNLEMSAITRNDFESFRKEVKADHEKIYDRLNDLFKGAK